MIDLARTPEIIVVLGAGFDERGELHPANFARAERAAELALARPRDAVIASGCCGTWDPTPPPVTEAEHIRDILVARGVAPERIFLEDESRDTVGNAVLTLVRYLRGLAPRPLVVVTSPFHADRSELIFRAVLGPAWPIEVRPSEPGAGDDERAAREPDFLETNRALLDGVEPGDVAAIAARLRERYPVYARLSTLRT
jgi:uncharacterized SAM-binding protein YcdF (DUF218 family)